MSKRNGGGAIRVAVAVTSAVRRAGLESIVRNEPDFQLAGSTGALGRLGLFAQNADADVILVDSDSLSEISELQAAIVLLSEVSDARRVSRLVKSGVRSILPRESDADEIVGDLRVL